MARTLSNKRAEEMIENGEAYKIGKEWYIVDGEETRRASASERQVLEKASKQ